MLKNEVELMAKMAKTIDGFTQHQTRLAVVIDGLDSCEQDKVLQMLDTVSVGQGSKVIEGTIWCTVCPRRWQKIFFHQGPTNTFIQFDKREEASSRLTFDP